MEDEPLASWEREVAAAHHEQLERHVNQDNVDEILRYLLTLSSFDDVDPMVLFGARQKVTDVLTAAYMLGWRKT